MEASPLPRVPIRALGLPDREKNTLHLTLDHQSREDEVVNGTSTELKYMSSFSRFPFVILLDGIVSGDPTVHYHYSLLSMYSLMLAIMVPY